MTTTDTLDAILRDRAAIARSQTDEDTKFAKMLERWNRDHRSEQTTARVVQLARAALAILLRLHPDEIPVEVIVAGYERDRAFGVIRADFGNGVNFEVNVDTAYHRTTVRLLVPCAGRTWADPTETEADPADGSPQPTTTTASTAAMCLGVVAGSVIDTLPELATVLADPPTELRCRVCQEAQPPF